MRNKEELLKELYPLLENELYQEIKCDEIPFCVLPNGIDHIINSRDKRKIKNTECVICKFNKTCNGFFPEAKHLIEHVKDLPAEIILEVTDKCNQDCYYCFNKYEYKTTTRNVRKELSKKELFAIIDKIRDFGLKYIRFSGGEPLLRKDIFELMNHAKGLKIWLNTNGTLVNETNSNQIQKYVENVLIPLNGYDEESDFKITKVQDSFKKKLKAFDLLKKLKIRRAGIVLTKENVNNLAKFWQIQKQQDITFLEFYRPITLKPDVETLKKAIDDIYRLNIKNKTNFKIANALPFCLHRPEITSKISLGSIYDDGHNRLVVSSDGSVKPSYYFTKKIGNALSDSFYKIWNDEFMISLRNNEFLPEICIKCKYKIPCLGGSRALAHLKGNIKERDVLLI